MMDFFLDEEENLKSPNLVAYIDPNSPPKSAIYNNLTQNQTQKIEKPEINATSANNGTVDVTVSMNMLKKMLSPELVTKTNGVYSFKISGIFFNSINKKFNC